jgi:hypothetical protein
MSGGRQPAPAVLRSHSRKCWNARSTCTHPPHGPKGSSLITRVPIIAYPAASSRRAIRRDLSMRVRAGCSAAGTCLIAYDCAPARPTMVRRGRNAVRGNAPAARRVARGTRAARHAVHPTTRVSPTHRAPSARRALRQTSCRVLRPPPNSLDDHLSLRQPLQRVRRATSHTAIRVHATRAVRDGEGANRVSMGRCRGGSEPSPQTRMRR